MEEMKKKTIVNFSFPNDGTYDKSYVDVPVVLGETSIIGVIREVTEESIGGVLWLDLNREMNCDTGLPVSIYIPEPGHFPHVGPVDEKEMLEYFIRKAGISPVDV